MNKYESLFKELINFHLDTKIWNNYDKLASTLNEVKSFETKLGVQFGEAMNTYLQLLGNGERFNGGLTMFNYQNILFATENLSKKKIYQKDQPIELNAVTHLTKSFKEICCINHIDYNGYFTLVNPAEENPNLFGGEAYDLDFDWHETNFTTALRNEVFFIVKNFCNAQRLILANQAEQIPNFNVKEIAQRIDFSNYDWLSFYQTEHRKAKDRLAFNRLMEIEEQKKNSLFGFEEYELKYIEFLKKMT